MLLDTICMDDHTCDMVAQLTFLLTFLFGKICNFQKDETHVHYHQRGSKVK